MTEYPVYVPSLSTNPTKSDERSVIQVEDSVKARHEDHDA
jgi:hypothetical protein